MKSDLNMALDAADVDTPRGISAKEEVRRLRALIMERSQQTMEMMARARFNELDVDNSGYLENAELLTVVEWVMSSFGDRLGTNPEEVRVKMMQRLDANQDGKLSIEEFESLFKEMVNRICMIERARIKFEEFDTNKNGTIESDEIRQVISWTLQAYPAASVDNYTERLIANIDLNKDGVLNLMEFTDLFEGMMIRMDMVNKAQSKFQELDIDKSGFIEKGELDALVNWVLESYVDRTPAQKSNFRQALLENIDVNKDGAIDIQEFTALFADMLERIDMVTHAKLKFKELDKNGNGFLDKNELAAVAVQWASHFHTTTGVDSSNAVTELLEQMDVNMDGKIDLQEFVRIFEEALVTKVQKRARLVENATIFDAVSTVPIM
jgi:Ca2+-binding EF-hand superfamily protein